MKKLSVLDFLTEKEFEQCIRMNNKDDIEKNIIKPNLTRINEKLGQENDSNYLAYAVMYVIGELKK